MTSRLRELIRAVRQSKTAAEERAAIAREAAAIRTAIKDDDNPYRARNVAKLMYMHMLGYSVEFGKIACINLITSEVFPEKRIGYLAVALVFDVDDPLLTLVQNQLQKDMMDSQPFVQALALHLISNIATESMSRDLLPTILKLLEGTNPFIRKKAALAALRVVRRVPELADMVAEKIPGMIADRNHGVLLGTVQLATDCIVAAPETVPLLDKKITIPFCRLLKNLLASSSAIEHDVSGIADPFLQCKILRYLRLLVESYGSESFSTKDHVIEILALVATNTEAGKNAGNAVLYECCLTVMLVPDCPPPLRILAINILGRFLLHKDNNLRYAALSSLGAVVNTDAVAIQKHRGTIVECLRDPDVSIQKRAAHLVVSLARSTNIDVLVPEMIGYCRSAREEMREDVVPKLCVLIEQYAPSAREHVHWMLELLGSDGRFVSKEHVAALISCISKSGPAIQRDAVQSMLTNLEIGAATRGLKTTARLVEVALWTVGEYGDLLPNANVSIEYCDHVLQLVHSVLLEPPSRRAQLYALTTLAKLSTRFSHAECRRRVLEILDSFRKVVPVELQARANEYFLMVSRESVRGTVFDRLPVYDRANIAVVSQNAIMDREAEEAALSSSLNLTSPVASSGNSANNSAAIPDLDRLLDFSGAPSAGGNSPDGGVLGLGIFSSMAVSAPQTSNTSSAPAAPVSVDSLFAGIPATSTASVSHPAPAMDDLLMSATISPSSAAPSVSEAPASGADSLLLSPTSQEAAPSTAAATTSSSAASAEIPSKDIFTIAGICIRADFKKHPSNEQVTAVRLAFRNDNSYPVENFVFQAAVPKYIKLELKAASTKSLPANGSALAYQEVRVTNSMVGQKPVVMRVKLEWDEQGKHRVEQGEINTFPPGL